LEANRALEGGLVEYFLNSMVRERLGPRFVLIFAEVGSDKIGIIPPGDEFGCALVLVLRCPPCRIFYHCNYYR
jgi:hypothetical protein